MTPASPAIRPALPAALSPGVYENVPFDTYRAWPAINQSLLGVLIDQSPEHCLYAEQNPEEDTEALLIGRALHSLILEPATFADHFVVSGQCSATKAKGDACTNPGKFLIGGQWLCGVHAKGVGNRAALFEQAESSFALRGYRTYAQSSSGSIYMMNAQEGLTVRIADHAPNARTLRWMVGNAVESVRVDLPPYGRSDDRKVLTAEQYELVQAMHARLLAHPRALEFLDCGTDNELSICWRDAETGLLCKARIDLYRALAGAIGDLKTTEDASLRAFKYAIRKYGYHRQGAWYLAGAAACGLDADTFAILAVEKPAPHGVSTLVLGEQMLSEGHEQIRRALLTYAECKQSGVWPGYTTGFTPIDFES